MDRTDTLVVLVISSSNGVRIPEDSMTGTEEVKSGIDFNRHSGGMDSAWVFLLSRAVAFHAGSPISPIEVLKWMSPNSCCRPFQYRPSTDLNPRYHRLCLPLSRGYGILQA